MPSEPIASPLYGRILPANGQLCDVIVLATKTDASAGAGGVTLFLVELDRPGFTRGRNLEKLGMKAQDTSELFFEDVRVPASNMLGREGRGFALGIALPLGNLYYAYLAWRLAVKEGGSDVTAMPYGPSVPHMFIVVFVIMLPTYLKNSAATGEGPAAILAWEAGLAWAFIIGVIVLIPPPGGDAWRARGHIDHIYRHAAGLPDVGRSVDRLRLAWHRADQRFPDGHNRSLDKEDTRGVTGFRLTTMSISVWAIGSIHS